MRFFFHYNKPQSSKVGKPIISLHFQKKCYLVENLQCNTKTWGKIRKSQPKFVIAGEAKEIKIQDNVAVIS